MPSDIDQRLAEITLAYQEAIAELATQGRGCLLDLERWALNEGRELISLVTELREREKRLRELVYKSYVEGANDEACYPDSDELHWTTSKAKRALDSLTKETSDD